MAEQSNKNVEKKSFNRRLNETKQRNRDRIQTAGFFSRIVLIIVFILLLAMLLRTISSGGNIQDITLPTFTNLLQKLGTAEVPSIPFINVDKLFLDMNWGTFQFLLDFFSFFVSLFNVVLFFINGLISAITYIVWFLQWLFLV